AALCVGLGGWRRCRACSPPTDLGFTRDWPITCASRLWPPCEGSLRSHGYEALTLHFEQFDFEDQRGIRRYHTACAARAIAELGWDDEGTLTADLHGGDTFVPTGDDPLSADGELKWPAAVERAVKFLALGAALIEPAG